MLKKVWNTVVDEPPAGWDESRGAADAAYLSARRIGWRFTDFETLCTDQGATISLSTTSPGLLSKLLREAVQRRWQRQMATGLSQSGWTGSRVCPDTITTVLRFSWAKSHRLEAHNACKAFCNAIWTGERAVEAGNDCDGMLCPDTITAVLRSSSPIGLRLTTRVKPFAMPSGRASGRQRQGMIATACCAHYAAKKLTHSNTALFAASRQKAFGVST